MKLSEVPLSRIRSERGPALLVDSFGLDAEPTFRVLYFPPAQHAYIPGRAAAFFKSALTNSIAQVRSATDHHIFSYSGSLDQLTSALMQVQRAIDDFEAKDPRELYSIKFSYPSSLLPLLQDQVWRRSKPSWVELQADSFVPRHVVEHRTASEAFVLLRGVTTNQAERLLDSGTNTRPYTTDTDELAENPFRGASKATLSFGVPRSSVILTVPSQPMPRALALAHTAALQFVFADAVSLLFTALRDNHALCYAPRVLSYRSLSGTLVHTIFSIAHERVGVIEEEILQVIGAVSSPLHGSVQTLAEQSFNSLAKWIRYSTTSEMILDFIMQIIIMSSDRVALCDDPSVLFDVSNEDISSSLTALALGTRYLTVIT